MDSVPLSVQLAERARDFNLALDLASVLVLDWPIGFPAEDFEMLTGVRPPPLPHGRVPIYICAECGDLGCGAVTATIEQLEDHVYWRDFSYENGYEPFNPEDVFAGVGPFTFERGAYLATLDAFRANWPGE